VLSSTTSATAGGAASVTAAMVLQQQQQCCKSRTEQSRVLKGLSAWSCGALVLRRELTTRSS
jgi:hypothetical protein